MIERRRIVDLWKRRDAAALVTLVRVEGSSYRRPGARLLIAANGDYAGAISGGCLEAEVIRKAAWKVREGAVIDRYSTLFDDTAEIPYGLGCGGTVDLLLEPAGTAEFNALMEAFAASLRGEHRRVLTTWPTPQAPLRRCVLDGEGHLLFGNSIEPEAMVFEEELLPPQRLVLIGAGDDAQPMARIASLMGWRTVVVDGRAQWAHAERFPEADAVLHLPGPSTQWIISSEDAVILMSHSYEQDRAWLTHVLPTRPRYLGLLGARHRSALLLSEAAATLGWPLERACEGVFAPMGLNLGGDGAEAIALATIAEIQATLSGKLPPQPRMTAETVREQIARFGGAARYLHPQCAI